MTESVRAVETEFGFVAGRDSLYVDDVQYRLGKVLRLIGEINVSRCSRYAQVSGGRPFRLTFEYPLAIRVVPLEFTWDIHRQTAFDEIVESEWVGSMRSDDHSRIVLPDHTHYRVMTYEDLIDVVARRNSPLRSS